MADKDLSNKILSALDSSATINVKKLRKQILLQIQTDADDKAAKKKFKKTVQALESEGKLTLSAEGEVTLTQESKKEKKKKSKKDKKDKKDKKKRKSVDEDESEEQVEKKQKIQVDDDEEERGDDAYAYEAEPRYEEETGDANNDDKDKNTPCPGNPSGYTRLFLGNLPFTVDEASLRDFLSPAKMTHVKWITDKETGKFYGSAFIEMKTSKCGATAVKERNGQKLLGRDMRINFAPSRDGDVWPPRSKEVTGNGGQAGGTGVKAMSVKPDNCMKLFVGNLSFEIDDDTIIKFFANVEAEVKAVRWLHHQDSGDFKGCGYVEFWNTEACEKGATLNGKNLMERPIRIDWTD
jgi:nucleolin